jgi:hypothetical protein
MKYLLFDYRYLLGCGSLAVGVSIALITHVDEVRLVKDVQSFPIVDRNWKVVHPLTHLNIYPSGDVQESFVMALDRIAVLHDPREAEILYENKPKEVIDAVAERATETLDSKCADLLGRMLFKHLGIKGEEYMEKELDGFVREWARIGYGAALLDENTEKFQEFLDRMKLSNARDNLVAMAVAKIGEKDAMAAYRLWLRERENIRSGTSPSVDRAFSEMVFGLATQCNRRALEQLLFSEEFLRVTANKGDEVCLGLSKLHPDLALQWADSANVSTKVKKHIKTNSVEK